MKYSVEIIETLSRVVSVEAVNQDEAINAVVKLYKNGEVVLSADDFVDVDFKAFEGHSDKNEKTVIT